MLSSKYVRNIRRIQVTGAALLYSSLKHDAAVVIPYGIFIINMLLVVSCNGVDFYQTDVVFASHDCGGAFDQATATTGGAGRVPETRSGARRWPSAARS